MNFRVKVIIITHLEVTLDIAEQRNVEYAGNDKQ